MLQSFYASPARPSETSSIKIEIRTMLIKIQPDATVRRYLFTAKSLYMFRVSQHPSSGVLKKGNLSLRYRLHFLVLLMMDVVTPETCTVTLQ